MTVGSWLRFLDEVEWVTRGVPYPFFRGHTTESFTLLPSLFRVRRKQYVECNIFSDFVSNAAPLMNNKKMIPIETLFEMRHANIPTRLLDWTTIFAVALYFATSGKAKSPCIWVLDPGKLNEQSIETELLVESDAVEYDYEKEMVRYAGKTLQLPLAIFPPMQSSRIFAQKGHFTIHGACEGSLETLCPRCVTRIAVPPDSLSEARRFLQLAGINEYSIFPDIDGLARFLVREHGLDRRLKIAFAKAARKQKS